MPKHKNRHNLRARFVASSLIFLHLATFGPVRDALAFNAQSTSYRLSAGALNEGGKSRIGSSAKLWQEAIGEPITGKAASASYILQSGFIPTIQANPPVLTQDIPYQSWLLGSSKPNAFDLDDYFTSPDGYALSYSVSAATNITISIDPATHLVSFSSPDGWSGVEKVIFQATDSEGSTTQSNEAVLQAEHPLNNDQPVIVDVELIPALIKEGDLVTLKVKAKDPDNDALSFSYNQLFTQTNTYQIDGFWYSEASWQTPANSTGHYSVKVIVKDPSNLTDAKDVLINIGNLNHAPILNPIPDITAKEGDLVVVTPTATDPDNDALTFYYSYPLDSTGKWLTDYEDEGSYAIKVTASDGIDTVSQDVKIAILKTNQPPQATLSLSKYTVTPNEEITLTLSATDPDSDTMSYSLKKDGTEISSGPLTSSLTSTLSFSAIGDHTISATVTDSGGLSSTVTKPVDVVDPNANRDAINPLMGDFNGDSLSDLGLHNSDTGTWEVCLSDKGSFTAALDWLGGFGTSRDWWPIGGDFNGDAKTDIGIYNNTTGELKIALSTGSGFSVSGTWLTFPEASYSWQPFTGNFNADKYTDFALYNKDTGEVKIALGIGSGFQAFTAWLNDPSATGYTAMSGDFNGDSLSDIGLFKKSSGEVRVIFSDSKGFVDGSTWITNYGINQDLLLSDFNSDGLTDIGYWDKSNFNWYYASSTGEKFLDQGIFQNSYGSSTDESANTADFDGNGITDLATFDKDQLGINRWKTRLSTLKPVDLLTEIDNGIGGKTQITYTYAAAQDNPGLPFPVYVASEVKLIDTLPINQPQEAYVQLFSFSGGYYDAVEREFRGFQKVKVKDPITNNYSETYFYQGKPGQEAALKGQIEKIISYDGNLRAISQTLNTYEVRKSGSSSNVLGAPFLTVQETTVWEENAASLTTKTTLTYDNIGNPLEERQEGDALKAGDEKIAQTAYAPAYELGFNRPLEVSLKDKDNNLISKKTFEYDTNGNLAQESIEISNPLTGELTNPITRYAYDYFGNLISTTNALGVSTTTDYETDFYAYPKTIANSLGHAISYTYNYKLGIVTSVTDANGITTSTAYDSLGRVLQVKNGLNQITSTYSYPDFNTKVSTNAIGLSSTEYIDGIGRKYQAVSSGEDGSISRQVSTETYFNNRGQVERESLTHYLDEDPSQISYIRYEYDIRGRLIKTISDFPGLAKDASSSITYKSPLESESTDPQGHRKASKKDVYGNILEVIEYAGTDGVFHTYYEYDIQGNLVKTTDNQGNITQIFYDSLGRKLKMIDPDMGTWSYEYDLLGNLIKQADAKGQILEFTYDILNRLIKKTSLRGSEATEAILAEYLYDDPLKPNCIGRLSKVIDQSGSTEFFYDTLGREIKSIKSLRASPQAGEAISYTVLREYDILDRLTKLIYPDGEVVSYSYDVNSGLLESLRGTKGAEAISYIQDISYSSSGQIKATSYGNGVTTSYTYGQDLRLSRIFTQNASSATLQDLSYDFDYNGNLKTLTDNLRSNIRTYLYDELDRLKETQNLPSARGGYTTFSCQYDSIGNMLQKSAADGSEIGIMSYGQNAGPHALTSAGGYAYTYDANGNMLQGKNKNMEYDVENRLVKVAEPTQTTTFTYDGDGGRVSKTVIANPPQAGEAISTAYIGSLYEVDSDGTLRKHIFAGANRVTTVIASPAGAKQSLYYHSDHLGSSNVITDGNGNLSQYCEYTPYGSTARNEGADLVKHKFTGKELDSTGLYYYGARYYDPEIGRFITADTIVQAPYDPQSLNRYSYCRNNPINYIDPTGHFWFLIIGAILGAISAAVNDQPIWQGVLLGALGAALVAGGAAAASGLWGSAWAFVGASVGGAASGAINGAVSGGNIGMSALISGIGAGIGAGLGYASGDQFWPGLGAAIGGGAASGAIGAAISGGDVGQGAWMGAAYSTGGYLASRSIQSANKKAKTEADRQSLQRKMIDTQELLDQGYADGGAEGQIKTSIDLAGLRSVADQAIGVSGKMMLTGLTDLSKAANFNVARAVGKVAGTSLAAITLGTDVANLTLAYQSHAPWFTKMHGFALVILDIGPFAANLHPMLQPLRWTNTLGHLWDNYTRDLFDRWYGK